MSKYQNYIDCPGHEFDEIGGYSFLCTHCGADEETAETVEEAIALETQVARLLAACEAQNRLIEAQTQMLLAYRIGEHPKEKTLKVMDSRQIIEKQAEAAIASTKGVEDD